MIGMGTSINCTHRKAIWCQHAQYIMWLYKILLYGKINFSSCYGYFQQDQLWLHCQFVLYDFNLQKKEVSMEQDLSFSYKIF